MSEQGLEAEFTVGLRMTPFQGLQAARILPWAGSLCCSLCQLASRMYG